MLQKIASHNKLAILHVLQRLVRAI